MTILEAIGISVLITRSSNKHYLAHGLNIILENYSCFNHFQSVLNLPFSVRVFSVYPLGGLISFDKKTDMNAVRLAEELVRLSKEARYDPPKNPGKTKGWEIRKAIIDGKPVAIALAKWI